MSWSSITNYIAIIGFLLCPDHHYINHIISPTMTTMTHHLRQDYQTSRCCNLWRSDNQIMRTFEVRHIIIINGIIIRIRNHGLAIQSRQSAIEEHHPWDNIALSSSSSIFSSLTLSVGLIRHNCFHHKPRQFTLIMYESEMFYKIPW